MACCGAVRFPSFLFNVGGREPLPQPGRPARGVHTGLARFAAPQPEPLARGEHLGPDLADPPRLSTFLLGACQPLEQVARIQMRFNGFAWTYMYSNVLTCMQMYSNVPQCIRMCLISCVVAPC